jgi:CDP-diacylglycerol---serine O-phosphatidyltransferase
VSSNIPAGKKSHVMTNLVKSIKSSIPNLFTLLNLLAGCTGILLSFYDLALAGLLIFLAGIMDFADGMAARVLNAYSDFGKELDSLADMVSFGVAPAFILFQIILASLTVRDGPFVVTEPAGYQLLILSVSFLPVVCAALRLARFNLDSNQKDSFTGLPSPAAGIFFASAGYILITTESLWIRELLLNTPLLVAVAIFISLLMISPLPMFNIKFRNFRPGENGVRYLFALPSVIILIVGGLQSIPAIIIYYIFLSFMLYLAGRLRRRESNGS